MDDCVFDSYRLFFGGHKQSTLSGFTLIEVLVTLLVLSIGFLGVASLHAVSLQQTHSSNFRSQAELLLRDMADKMRNNASAARQGLYLHEGAAIGGDAMACLGSDANCSSEEMAQADLAEWTQRLADPLLMPNGRGKITQAAVDGLFTLTVSWSETMTRYERESASEEESCVQGRMAQQSCLAVRVYVGG